MPALPGAPSPPRLSATVPQKSAVNTPKSNTSSIVAMKTKMGTSLQVMTMAFRTDASSTPRLTTATMIQLSSEMNATAPTVRPSANGGKKYPIAVASMTPNATLPIQMDSQYPHPETNPVNGPNPSLA